MAGSAKTQPGPASVSAFLEAVDEPQRRQDCLALAAMMQAASGADAQMWGASIVGFGRYVYRYANGRDGEWPLVGFSPRKGDLALYLAAEFEERDALLQRLGKHRTGKACVYLKRLSDVDAGVLRELIDASIRAMADQRVDR